MSRRKSPVDRKATIAGILDRCKRDPDEPAYFTAFVDVLETVVDPRSPEFASALLSRLAHTTPWMIDEAARRASRVAALAVQP